MYLQLLHAYMCRCRALIFDVKQNGMFVLNYNKALCMELEVLSALYYGLSD